MPFLSDLAAVMAIPKKDLAAGERRAIAKLLDTMIEVSTMMNYHFSCKILPATRLAETKAEVVNLLPYPEANRSSCPPHFAPPVHTYAYTQMKKSTHPPGPRRLNEDELVALRADMKEASEVMRGHLAQKKQLEQTSSEVQLQLQQLG